MSVSVTEAGPPPLLAIRGLSKSFGSHHVLRSVDLDVSRGEVVTVIGPSGSGKTTLLRCVNFLETYDGGSIRIDGAEVGFSDGEGRRRRGERDLARMRAETGMVFQQFNLFPHLTAAENVMLGLRRVRGKGKAEARSIAEHWLGRVGLGHKADSLPGELSGGQQQRVGIARAVAMDPKILLLDEITSALDPELVGEVLDVVRSLAGDGMTMLMVTHEIAFARDASHRIVFMADGAVAAEGPPAELVANTAGNERLGAFLARFRASHI
ncbi:polar amino acid transport system ATP-binding protein [Pseudoxanthobacter soli DSM 19599]|uniref:Polar amino acid transport system ATP-binding protein n=1 Tax=Pseudoxanthobacter soli DSM 19599 TaxID=1123029 RepID=A0A1M7ZN69_9HYPH|nr:amino acid ABC transporter ATP-binding protein [Pseudoxanthobacter soli]SHO66327.1 polar amino acid transport system ATP-binding protein [Pseudoxanthobacter soli DSM 19599]